MLKKSEFGSLKELTYSVSILFELYFERKYQNILNLTEYVSENGFIF